MDGIVGHLAKLGSLIIPIGQTDSGDLLTLAGGRVGLGASRGITVYAPTSLDGNITVQVRSLTSATWRTLYSGGTAVGVPTGAAVTISPPVFANMRLHADTPQADNRLFDIDSQIG